MLNEEPGEATVQSDPFDLSRLRLSQDFAEKIGVKKAVIKPNVPLGLGRNPENDTLDGTASDEE